MHCASIHRPAGHWPKEKATGCDVAEGEKIPRKGGPGITRSDLLVINKIDLAPLVGANLRVMEADALRMRIKRPFIFTNLKSDEGVDQIASFVIERGGLGAKERMSKNEDVERNGLSNSNISTCPNQQSA